MQNTKEKATKIIGKLTDTNFSQENGEVHIFPFVLRNGYQNVSQRGFESKGVSSEYFSFFQKVFTGRETITATWEDSTQLNVRDASLGTYNYDFKVGKYYLGTIVPGTLTHSMDIGDVNGNESYMSMQEAHEVTILFSRNAIPSNELEGSIEEHSFLPTEDDLYNLYIIPETKLGYKWLYISNVQSYMHPQNKKVILTQVTFTSLKDKLEQSGRALEQYVQYSAPGEPYAFPYIDYDGKVRVSPLRIDERIFNPVKYLQVELQGASAISSFTVLGRKLYWDSENKKWYTSPSKFLLPYRLVQPQANPLAKTSAPTKNFYCFIDEQVETRSTAEWLDAIKKQGTELAPIQNMGSFTLGLVGDKDKTKGWLDGVHISNLLNDGGYHTDYIDVNWKPLSYIDDAGKERDVTGNVYTTNKVKYTKEDDMRQVLIKNSMANLIQLELPLSMKQTKPYRWSNIPIIGFWTRWFGDRALTQNTINVKTSNICYFMDTNLATMQYNAFTQPAAGGQAYGNLQMFNGQEAPAMLNPQSANTTICCELTDKVSFTDDKYTGVVGDMEDGIDTVYLSQTQDENGNFLHNDESALLLNCEDNALTPQYTPDGFIIDAVVVNALHIGKVKISCYGKQSGSSYGEVTNPVFTQTVLSNSAFEEHNIRNWTTELILGCWDSNWSSGQITWPLAPQKEINPTTEINVIGQNIDYIGTNQDGQLLYDDKDPSGSNHPFNWVENEETQKSQKLAHTARKQILREEVISYLNLPGDYKSKQDFLDKVDRIQFNLTGTKCKIDDISCDLNDKYLTINMEDLDENDEAEIYNALGSFNCSYHNPLDQKDVGKLTYTIRWGWSGYYQNYNGAWNQCVKIKIGIRDEGIYYKIEEDTSAYAYAYNPPYEQDYTSRVYMTRNNKETHIISQIKIPNFKIINKEQPNIKK